MQFLPGVALSLASAVVSVAVAVVARGRDVPGVRGVAAFSASAAVWAGGNAVQLAATGLHVKILAVDAQYVGILSLPVAWFVFDAEYTGREQWVNRRTVGALAVFPAVVFVAVLTNHTHHLVRATAALESAGGTVRVVREFGPLFWVATAYSWMVSSVGTMLLVEHAIRVGSEYRRQTVAVLAGATVPWAAQTAYLAGATTIEPESFLGVTALAFGYAIVRHNMLDVAPVARDQVFEELDDGVLVVDGAGRVADANEAAERLLDDSIDVGADVDDVVPVAVREAFASEESGPVRVRNDDGVSYLNVDGSPVSSANAGEVVLLRDVTELQRRRSEINRENDRRNRVADTISHDLRNPLNVADGYLELAEESGDHEDFERVREALDRMDNIIEGTLRMARADLHAPEKSDVALADAVDDAWLNVVADGATLDNETRDVTVRADPDQLEGLLENVFRNAVEHGGDAASITVGVVENGDGFYVADDGPGIPATTRDEAFERGYTTSDDGTGLGLAIVADIADAHDWTVDLVESERGGARLNVTDVTTAIGEPAGA